MKKLVALLTAVAVFGLSAPVVQNSESENHSVYASETEEKFESDNFFVVVGTYSGSSTELRQIYKTSEGIYTYHKVVWKNSPDDLSYGDILIAENEISMEEIYPYPDDAMYGMASYNLLNESTKLKKVSGSYDILAAKDLTVTDNLYIGSGYFKIFLKDENNHEYCYNMNYLNSKLDIDLSNSSIGETYKFAFYEDYPVIPLEKVLSESSEKCGENAEWKLDEDGVLTISGSGEMTDYGYMESPFYQNSSIKEVVISKGITSIGNDTFCFCRNISKITIPDTVISIGNSAFYATEKLTELIIPDSVTSIGAYAFGYCSSLSDVTLPDSVTEIGEWAFKNTPWFEQNREPLYIVNGKLLDGKPCKGDVIIPDNVTSIENNAFDSGYGITSITISDSVKSIGEYAFCNCINMKRINIPEGVTSISTSAFQGCSRLTEIALPKYVIDIDTHAFSDCSLLKEISFSDYVMRIGYSAFSNCQKLTGITIPKRVTYINDYTFYNCSSLESVTLHDSVEYIGESAFKFCSELKEITIPKSVTQIGENAFSNCSDSLTISGYTNTAAQRYAEDNDIPFIALDSALITTTTANSTTTTSKLTTTTTASKPTTSTTSTTTSTTTQPPTTTVTYSYGDVTGDGIIDATDASFVLTAYAKSSTNEDDGMTEEQRKFADVNKDGVVDAVDASAVLTFYALSSTGNKQTFEKFIASLNK